VVLDGSEEEVARHEDARVLLGGAGDQRRALQI